MSFPTLAKMALHALGIGLIVIGILIWSSPAGPATFLAGLVIEGVGYVVLDRVLRRSAAQRQPGGGDKHDL